MTISPRLARRARQRAVLVHDRRPPGPRRSPTEPGLRSPRRQRVARHLVRGFGHPVRLDHAARRRAASSSAMTCGGSGDDEERMKRSGWRRDDPGVRRARRRSPGASSAPPCTRSGRNSSSHAKNCGALKPGVQTTLEPPPTSGASSAGDQPVDVEQRHDVQAAVVRVERERARDVRRGRRRLRA